MPVISRRVGVPQGEATARENPEDPYRPMLMQGILSRVSISKSAAIDRGLGLVKAAGVELPAAGQLLTRPASAVEWNGRGHCFRRN